MKVTVDADLFLFDLDGTVYLGDTPVPGAIDALKSLEEAGKKVCFLTNNSSKDPAEYVEKLTSMGYPAKAEQIVTSATATVHFLTTERAGKSVYPIGTPTFERAVREAGITVDEENADIVLLAFDTGITYDKFWHANVLLGKGSEFIATHPDKICPSDKGDMPDVGSLAALLECSSGKKVSVYCGKPYAAMAEIVKHLYDVPAERIAMVGDRLYTDILFGVNNGFVSVAVFTGETTPEMLAASDIRPTYAMGSVCELTDE